MTTDVLIQTIALHNTRSVLLLFFTAGLVAHFIDYKKLKDQPQFRAERKFILVASRVFVYGSLVLLAAVQVFNWTV